MIDNDLVERVVRSEELFFSLLFNHKSRTIRVVDFFAGNFSLKQSYLEKVLSSEGMRKVFTLIERSEVPGWRRIGYICEGTVPGYFKRSDAHIMSRIYDENWTSALSSDEIMKRSSFLAGVETEGEKLSALKAGEVKSEPVASEEAYAAIEMELERQRSDIGGGERRVDGVPIRQNISPSDEPSLFGQFGPNAEHHYWVVRHRRTKQCNVYGIEHQSWFGNARISMYFTPDSRVGRTMSRQGLSDLVDWLDGLGVVSIFALVRADNQVQNEIYAAAGFRNGGWMQQQLLSDGNPVDMVLWTMKQRYCHE